MKQYFLCTFFLLAALPAFAQSQKEAAKRKIIEGAALVDKGKFEEALVLLKEGAAMDPGDYHWAYEVGYAYYAKKDYRTAVEQYRKVVSFPDADAQSYQMLGNSLDLDGDSVAAMNAYRAGLKKFPESGMLLMELGNMSFAREDYHEALRRYEEGIKQEPGFASNYYRAARIYLHSSQKVWGMIYGETFMNMERNSERTSDMSKELYDTYRKAIHRTSDTSMSVAFAENIIDASAVKKDKDGKMILPFNGTYEQLILLSAVFQKGLETEDLVAIRTSFLKAFFDQKFNQQYPNLLFDYQKKIRDAGHLDAYNHWILMKGDEAAFDAWQTTHQQTWNAFTAWFSVNKMVVDQTHHLSRN